MTPRRDRAALVVAAVVLAVALPLPWVSARTSATGRQSLPGWDLGPLAWGSLLSVAACLVAAWAAPRRPFLLGYAVFFVVTVGVATSGAALSITSFAHHLVGTALHVRVLDVSSGVGSALALGGNVLALAVTGRWVARSGAGAALDAAGAERST